MSMHLAQTTVDDRRRWSALIVLCLGVLMVSINSTIVHVALPTIKLDLRFSDASLVWVVNAYLATFGGFLLLGGRLGDFFGHRRLFLVGVMVFTLTSLGCGLTTSRGLLVAARAGQGLGGAIISAVVVSQIMALFCEASKRTRALGVYLFASAGGGSIGLLLGGFLTSALSWQWVFLANVPIGVGICALCIAALPRGDLRPTRGRLDVAGAVTATVSLMIAVYAIVNSHHAGLSSAKTLIALASAGVLLVTFVGIEVRAQTPLIPLQLFRTRNLTVAIIVSVLLAAAVHSWSFVAALYLQLVLQFSALQVALAFLPVNLAIAVMSLFVSPALVIRFGNKRPLVAGMLIACFALALLARAPVSANAILDVLPGMLLLGLGTGMAYNPLLLCALSSVASCNSGAASGMINTAFMMGGALGLAALVSIAASWTGDLLVSGAGLPSALNDGYQVAFCIGAALVALAALISGALLRDEQQSHRDREDIGVVRESI